jgi:hypothetical protein
VNELPGRERFNRPRKRKPCSPKNSCYQRQKKKTHEGCYFPCHSSLRLQTLHCRYRVSSKIEFVSHVSRNQRCTAPGSLGPITTRLLSACRTRHGGATRLLFRYTAWASPSASSPSLRQFERWQPRCLKAYWASVSRLGRTHTASHSACEHRCR